VAGGWWRVARRSTLWPLPFVSSALCPPASGIRDLESPTGHRPPISPPAPLAGWLGRAPGAQWEADGEGSASVREGVVHRDVLATVLAGGRGSRLEPLTRDGAKPAVPFGGIYRIIDFTLSNCINSDLRKVLVLTQYKAVSLNRHIDQGWKFLCRELDEYIEVIPPQQRIAEHWYQGTADAIYQNVYTIETAAPRATLILACDHIYKMAYAKMIAFHRERRADLTLACLPVARSKGSEFGVIDVDASGRVVSFLEKPKDPPGMPDNPTTALVSMGIYVFATDVMYEL